MPDNNIYKTIIIENEASHFEVIKDSLARLFPEVVIIARATSVPEAIALVRMHKPDFIILDVELDNNRLGFEILDALSDLNFQTLFISSFNQYMRKAFLSSATDYIEKPFTDELFSEAMANTLGKINAESKVAVQQQLDTILKYIEGPMILNSKLRIINADGVHPIPVENIVYVEAQGSRCAFHLRNKKTHLISSTLGEYEHLLDRYNFVRVHRSYIVNMEHIQTYVKRKHDLIMYDYDKEIPITPPYRTDFDQRYSDYTFGN